DLSADAAGVARQHVDRTAGRALDRVDPGRGGGAVAQIDLGQGDAGEPRIVRRRIEDVAAEHARAGIGEAPADGTAEADGGAADRDDLAGEIERHDVVPRQMTLSARSAASAASSRPSSSP